MSNLYKAQRRHKLKQQRTQPQPEPQLTADDKEADSQCQCCGESSALDDTGLCKNCAGQDAEDLRYW